MRRKPQLRGRAARLARLLPAGRARAARTPFVLLVVLLLGGGLIGLLMLNSALSEGSFKLADLQKQTKNLTDEEQALQRDIDAYSSPDALQRRARQLGMVPGGDPVFLGPDGRVKGVPSPAPESAAFTDPVPPEVLTPAPGPSAATPGAPGPALSGVPAPATPGAPAAATAGAATPPQGLSQPAPSVSAAAAPPPPASSQPTPTPTPTPTPGR
ncbi:septum formation initiator family protein [Streptomyces sp. NBC_00557]|uniref:septum formation initiator family protein n=1 Tax=Streptomyces sp. NBC_00557 TaxID=2975776 RepID=UPI002E81B20C|nr:septum formation initiator family protein [Streptomyces sp. NBC_00557]WUC37605.1 septum formation initiator family protein [Streptomyces sp. NBC_00557]